MYFLLLYIQFRPYELICLSFSILYLLIKNWIQYFSYDFFCLILKKKKTEFKQKLYIYFNFIYYSKLNDDKIEYFNEFSVNDINYLFENIL